jgi:hypothetical protein
LGERFIPTRFHGILDYLWSLLLASMPWLLNYPREARGGPETWVPVAFAAGAVVYSLLTDYELGAVRVLPMRVHLLLDVVGGALLVLSTWLFDLRDPARLVYLGFGLFSILAGLMTETRPFRPAVFRP